MLRFFAKCVKSKPTNQPLDDYDSTMVTPSEKYLRTDWQVSDEALGNVARRCSNNLKKKPETIQNSGKERGRKEALVETKSDDYVYGPARMKKKE